MYAATSHQYFGMDLSWTRQVERLIFNIEARAREMSRPLEMSGPLLVSIDSKSGSGKSTLAEMIRQKVKAAVIFGDDFSAGGEKAAGLRPKELVEICIDWQVQRTVLKRFHLCQTACFFAYDWSAFDGSKKSKMARIEALDVVLLEGVYSARPELRDLIDLTVLLEVPNEDRHKRLLAREGEISAWERQWHRAEDWYFATSAPRECFDVVLDRGSASEQ